MTLGNTEQTLQVILTGEELSLTIGFVDIKDAELPVYDRISPFRSVIIVSMIGLSLIALGLRFWSNRPQDQVEMIESTKAEPPKEIKIHVSGAVVSGGVYALAEGDRVEDAISKAGGLSKEADSERIEKELNFAAKLTDGTKLYIPARGELLTEEKVEAKYGGSQTLSSTSININSASMSELDELPGVGAVTAQKIVDGRPFESIEDLLTRKIVNQSTFAKLKEKISVY
ncbi:MAG: ComEA family DNA-binding protein [Patescibacteria group bacterium]